MPKTLTKTRTVKKTFPKLTQRKRYLIKNYVNNLLIKAGKQEYYDRRLVILLILAQSYHI